MMMSLCRRFDRCRFCVADDVDRRADAIDYAATLPCRCRHAAILLLRYALR